MVERITLRCPMDWHLHLRQGEALAAFARASREAGFHRVLVMPNTRPPVCDVPSLAAYRREILQAVPDWKVETAFKIMPGMTFGRVGALKGEGARAGKYYPAGATTNAGDGLQEWRQAEECLEAMEALGVVLSIHAEVPEGPGREREAAFLPQLEQIRRRFPRLKMVMEHVSTREGVEWVRQSGENTAATVTAHHLLFSREEEIDPSAEPHWFCRPVLKSEEHRSALEEAVLAGEEKFFFGSDSAPHPLTAKEPDAADAGQSGSSAGQSASSVGQSGSSVGQGGSGSAVPAGVFSAPAALGLLAEFFHSRGALDKLEGFVSLGGARFYGVEVSQDVMVLERRDHKVPDLIGGARPLLAGETLSWRVLTG